MVGEIPDEAARWRRRHNYYLNCLRDADRNIVEAHPAQLLRELLRILLFAEGADLRIEPEGLDAGD